MAASFDGIDDCYQLAGETTLRYEYTQAFSGHVWIKKTSVTGFCIMGKAQNSPPGAQQRGWAFNTESLGGNLGISFHLVNTAALHAFKAGVAPSGGQTVGNVPNLYLPVGFTYSGSGLTSGMTLYMGGVPLSTFGSPVDTLGGNTILVNGTPVRLGGFDTEFWAGAACGHTLFAQELSAADMLKLADIRNLNTNPSSYLGISPAFWLPLNESGGSVDLTDLSGNGHDASVSTGAPAATPDPSVVFDTFSQSDFTSTTSFSHAAVGNVTAVAVMVGQDVSGSDLISGVTYGGVAMTRLPTNGFAQDTAGEAGASYMYLLTSGVPQGTQTVAITVASGTDAKTAFVVTLNSTGAVSVTASAKVEGDVDDPSATLATSASWAGLVLNILYSGLDDPASITAGTGLTALGAGRDFGSQVTIAEIGNASGANFPSGWTTTASDDVAMITAALEAADLAVMAWIKSL